MIKNGNIGTHENVPTIEFVDGSIKLCKGQEEGKESPNLLILYGQKKQAVGTITRDWEGKSTDDLPAPGLVLKFTDPRSVAVLASSLMDLYCMMIDDSQD